VGRSQSSTSCLAVLEIDSNETFYEHIVNTAKNNLEAIKLSKKSQFGPFLSIGIIFDCYGLSEDICGPAASIVTEYAAYHEYSLNIIPSATDLHWRRLNNIVDAFENWASDMDYIVYVHADVAILDMNWRIEQLALKHKKSNAIFFPGTMGTFAISHDFFIFRNNKWSKNFINDWKRYKIKGKTTNDFYALEALYAAEKEDLDDYITFIPTNTLRAEYPVISNLRSSHVIAHFPSINQAEQVSLVMYQHAYENICYHISHRHNHYDPIAFETHNGITKSMILQWSIDVFYPLWENDLKQFATKSSTGGNTHTDTERLSSLVNSITLALEAQKSEQENNIKSEESLSIRSKSFKQLFLNMKRRRGMILRLQEEGTNTSSLTDTAWQSILQHTLSVGQEYIARSSTDDKDHKITLKLIKEILEELYEIDPKNTDTQEALVNMNVDVGMIAMKEKRYDDALTSFLAGLRIARKVGAYIGENVVLQPASHAAEAMVQLERFEEAVVLYETVVYLTGKYIGEDSLTLAYVKVQAALANNNIRKFKTANKLLEQALTIMNNESQEGVDEGIYELAFSLYEKTHGKKNEEIKDL
jgi:tetratricopeptide (TPR) repeat protein